MSTVSAFHSDSSAGATAVPTTQLSTFPNRICRRKVKDFNDSLICSLCKGYLIEATTVNDCLHAFCRSCIVRYLESNKFCPKCKSYSNKTITVANLRPDRILKSLVYKLVPGLYKSENQRVAKFYADQCQDDSSAAGRGKGLEHNYMDDQNFFSPDELISLSLQYHHDSIADYDPKSTTLPITYLHCPAAVTIHHLYKFILTKNGLQLGNERIQMDIIYEDEILPHEFTLMDVAYCYDYKRVSVEKEMFCFHYEGGILLLCGAVVMFGKLTNTEETMFFDDSAMHLSVKSDNSSNLNLLEANGTAKFLPPSIVDEAQLNLVVEGTDTNADSVSMNCTDPTDIVEVNPITIEAVTETSESNCINFDFGEMLITVDTQNQEYSDCTTEIDLAQTESELITSVSCSGNEQPLYSTEITENSSQKKGMSRFLTEPDTPKKKNKKFKRQKSPPVLTSKKRLELHLQKEQEKENMRLEKLKKVENKRMEKMKRAHEKQLIMIKKATDRLQRLNDGLK
ncbi:uncharacterized protein LOC129719808 [Wyeomyia smithii]|uniref:uncharacterized protein LOC129719808 n=1 Tax=Wyeomyia smithii TaxID=174621 RepID=UPI002467F263|nr:uncharacterized protein LOC129719808 [Wyeomyia smithii]